MMDAKHPVAGAGGACPDFEVLSCFADGELDGEEARTLASHIAGCTRCGALSARLRAAFEVPAVGAQGASPGSGCIGEERLVAYATGELSDPAGRSAVAEHLGGCDPCVAALTHLHRRLTLSVLIPTPVPASLARQAEAVLPAAMAELAPAPQPASVMERSGTRVVERLRSWLQMPVLAPLAIAAAALFMVAIGLRPDTAPPDAERSRAIAPDTVRLAVQVAEAPVHARPSGRAAVIGSVTRGERVAVAGTERDWYEVRLADGRTGWVLREAFE